MPNRSSDSVQNLDLADVRMWVEGDSPAAAPSTLAPRLEELRQLNQANRARLARTPLPPKLLDDLRYQLAAGAVAWPVPDELPDLAELPARTRSFIAAVLWQLVIWPGLPPMHWEAALQAISSRSIALLTIRARQQRLVHRQPDERVRAFLEHELAQPAHATGVTNLLDELADLSRAGRFLQELRAEADERPLFDLALLLSLLALEPAAEDTGAWLADAWQQVVASGSLIIPVRAAEWRDTIQRRTERFGQRRVYWCYVPGGRYRVGGWAPAAPAAEVQLKPFWIARVPITVGQWAAFMELGYGQRRWWSSEGWRWKADQQHSAPWRWAELAQGDPNRPMTGVTWYEASAFAAWVQGNIRMVLRADHTIRLPTEAEWEIAAAYDAQGQRHPYPWGDEAPTPERAIYGRNTSDNLPPVGSSPDGAAPCGALDMLGTVWELMQSSYAGYPSTSAVPLKSFAADSFDVPLRGANWRADANAVHCATRICLSPEAILDDDGGLRLVIAPRNHQ